MKLFAFNFKTICTLTFTFFIFTNQTIVDENINELIRIKIENIDTRNSINTNEKLLAKKSINVIYSQVGFKQIWTQESEIKKFIDGVAKANEEGLNPEDYHYESLVKIQLNKLLSADQKAERDLLLTDAFLIYSSHLLSGKVNPELIKAEWYVQKKEGDPLALFIDNIATNNFESAIQSIMPKNKRYIELKKSLAEYKLIQQKGGWNEIAVGQNISVGMYDQRITAIKKRLTITNDYNLKPLQDTSTLYSKELAQAVIAFQKRHGFPADGKIDLPTIKTMNITVDSRIKQIELNLERLRWMPQEYGNYYIMVNIANFDLNVIKNGEIEVTHKIIAGKPARKTPAFSSKVSYLVFNPTWTVPPTILRKDVIPEVRKSTQYLVDKNINVYNNQGQKLLLDTINWNSNSVYAFTYRQEAGPKNALGAVKFMFPNSFNVYLHDTPSKELFAKSERAFSSGCIRVESPLKLAEYLLNDNEKWNANKIQKIIDSNITQTVQLQERPQVHILYLTSWSKENTTFFRKDVYDRDDVLYAALTEKPQ